MIRFLNVRILKVFLVELAFRAISPLELELIIVLRYIQTLVQRLKLLPLTVDKLFLY